MNDDVEAVQALTPAPVDLRSASVVDLPPALARRFEALVFDWDGTAVPDRLADASRVRELVEQLCAAGVHVVVVSGTHVGNVDPQLGARPAGPGRLLLALNRGSEVFEVDADGPRLVWSRVATPAEDAALTRAAEKIVNRLGARGLEARVVSQRLNRRKIDLIPVPDWDDPPKAVIDDLLAAVEARLAGAGIGGITDVAALAIDIAHEEGLADAKVTSDAKHVEVGLTDKADASRVILDELWQWGIAAEQICFGGDEFGPLGGMPGSDALMLIPETSVSAAMSVGVEPNGVPAGVIHVPGGPPRFVEFLEDQLRRRADIPSVVAREDWSLVVDGIDPLTERARSAMLTLADGVIGTTGAPLLSHPAAQLEVVAAGVYDGDGPATDLLAAPTWSTLGARWRHGDRVRRVLDLHTAQLREDVDGATTLRSVRFSSLARPGVAVLRADVDPPAACEPLRAPDNGSVVGHHNGRDWLSARGAGGSITVAAAQDCVDSRIERVAAYVPGPDGPLGDDAVGLLDAALDAGFERLLAEHRHAWAQRWEHADVRVDGDPAIQRAIRLSLFHLMSSVGDVDHVGEAAVGARGLTGHAYRGHVFWDADLFVLPFLAATHPAAARAMLEYRIRRLPVALDRARREGRKGARFPWESAFTGEDVTPHAGRDLTGHVVPIRTGESEIHIVGDVAWASCCYADWTGDAEFAAGPGLELLVATARYFASRIRVDAEGRGHLYGVIGPDEYHEPVDDNAYTNVLARWNLRRAAIETERFGAEDVSQAEREQWYALAAVLHDGYDDRTGIYEQFAGFFELEPMRIADVAPRRPITADLLLGRDRVRAAQVVKQADVVMLYHLLPGEMAEGSLATNLDYYEPRTAHGSSLSPAIHAAVMARAGRLDAALETFRVAANIDLDDLTATGAGGVHLAAMGGLWQAVAYGFLGLTPAGDALAIDPQVPPEWDALEVRVSYRGVAIAVRASAGELSIRADAGMVVEIAGVRSTIAAGETVWHRNEEGAYDRVARGA